MELKINQKYMFDGENGKQYTNDRYTLSQFYRQLHSIGRIIVHCTATDSKGWDDPIACINYDLQPNHISKRGCPFATYHFYINKPGDIYQLLSLNYYTWHVSGHNRDTVAIVINNGGEKKSQKVTPAQYESLIQTINFVFDLLDWERDKKHLPERVWFHRDFANKLCPGVHLDKKQVHEDIMKLWDKEEEAHIEPASAVEGKNVMGYGNAKKAIPLIEIK